MKKNFSVYAICWTLMLALFNIIVFVTPNEIGGASKFTGGFWIGYGVTVAVFIGQLACAFFALKEAENRKVFYNIPLIWISYGALLTTLVVGAIFMAIPVLPAWIAAIVCGAVLVFSIIAVIKAKSAAEVVSGIDEKIAGKTAFIKELTVRAKIVMLSSTTPELKAEAKRVYEAIRYSDPMSSEKLAEVENELSEKFAEFEQNTTVATANEIIALVNKRAELCKALKK